MLAAARRPGDSALLANRRQRPSAERAVLRIPSGPLAGWKLDTAALLQEPQGRSPTKPPPARPLAPQRHAATPRASTKASRPSRAPAALVLSSSTPSPPRTGHLAGQVWPGQTMEWEIEDPAADGAGGDEPDETGTAPAPQPLPAWAASRPACTSPRRAWRCA